MEKKDLIPGDDALHYLRTAALFPQRRSEMIGRALQEFLTCLPAVGTALIWPCQDRKIPWRVYYVGNRQEAMQPWLRARLHFSLDATLGVLQQDLSKLSDMPFPHFISLQPAPMFPGGLWIVWTTTSPLSSPANTYQENVRLMLEALIEVESTEDHYFSDNSPLSDQALIEAFGQGDSHALSTLLGMTRLIGNADVTVWGRAYQDAIEAKDQMGAKQNGFGFVIPRGRGVSGQIVAYGASIITVEDYRNSPYRHPSVSDTVDSEQIRSVIALPIRSRSEQEKHKQISGILYASRRIVKPFSLTEQLLVQRLTHYLEPLPQLTRPPSYPSLGLPSVSDQKAAWYKLILHTNHIESLETWVSHFVKGTIIVVDNDGNPYVSARSEQLERLQASLDSATNEVQIIPLDAPGVSFPGKIYLRSAIALPPPDWPDFYVDLIMACNLIIGRMEQARDHLARQREQWLHTMLQEKSLTQIRQDGYRLGLPVGEGQLWVIAWPPQKILPRQAARKRIQAENIVLDQLNSPLLFFGDDIGVILLDEHSEHVPAKLHDALLTQFAPHPLWIVYGAHYDSLHDLKTALTHCVSHAQKARREKNSEYLLDVQTPGLESLLTNPRLTEDLHTFATKLLAPLLEYDKNKGSELTTTFILIQTLGSVQAVSEELGVHVNTIRYRLHKAEEILGIEEASPKERIAWGFASFIWQDHYELEDV